MAQADTAVQAEAAPGPLRLNLTWFAPALSDPPPYETRPSFLMINRHKRGITLDLKTAEGVALLRRLAAGSDLMVENYASGFPFVNGTHDDAPTMQHVAYGDPVPACSARWPAWLRCIGVNRRPAQT